MDPFEIGDPYIEWGEENFAREELNELENTEESVMEEEFSLSNMRDKVINILVTRHDFTIDDAEEAVDKCIEAKPDMWNENADADHLANFLADDDDDE